MYIWPSGYGATFRFKLLFATRSSKERRFESCNVQHYSFFVQFHLLLINKITESWFPAWGQDSSFSLFWMYLVREVDYNNDVMLGADYLG